MRIDKLFIRGFGKMVNYSLDSSKDFTQINENNGFGKTTIIKFISAMLFGLNQTAKKNINEDDRKKYYPWDSNSFGGTLDITYNGKKYQIDRTFSKKASEDSFKLIDLKTNKETNDFGPNIGEAILNVNKDSFYHTSCIIDSSLDFSEDDADLKSRLISVMGNLPDATSSTEALNQLESKENEITRKNGLIYGKKEKISQTTSKIKEIEDNKKNIVEYEKSKSEYSIDLDKINKEIEVEQAKIKEYSLIAEKNAKISVALSKKDELDKLEEKLNNYPKYIRDLKAEDILDIENAASNYNSSIANKEMMKIDIFERDLKSYEKFNIDDSKIKKLENDINSINTGVAPAKKSPLFFIILAISALLLVGGIILLILNKIVPSVVLLVLGLLGVILDLYLSPSKKVQPNNDTSDIKAFFITLGYQNLSDLNSMLIDLKTKKSLYAEKKEALDKKYDEINTIDNKIKQHKSELDKLVEPYGIVDESYLSIASKLRDQLTDYQYAEKSYLNAKEKYEEFISENNITSFDSVDVSNYDDIKAKIDELNSKKMEIEANIVRCDNQINDANDELAKIDELNEEKSLLEQEVNDLKAQADIYHKTYEFLNASLEKLKAKYVEPITKSMDKYLKVLSSAVTDFAIDTEFKFYGIENGERKDIKYYSRGINNLISLAFRLSVIEVLYEKEKPIIILDDPFVHLDDNHLDLAKSLIDELTKEYQVVYITCNKSRSF